MRCSIQSGTYAFIAQDQCAPVCRWADLTADESLGDLPEFVRTRFVAKCSFSLFRDASIVAKDQTDHLRDILQRYLEENAFVDVRYEPTKEQKNNPEYAILVGSLPCATDGEPLVCQTSPPGDRHLRNTSDTCSRDPNQLRVGACQLAQRWFTSSVFQRLLCGSIHTSCSREPVEMLDPDACTSTKSRTDAETVKEQVCACSVPALSV